MNPSEKTTAAADSGEEIVNQYGQLVGEFSKLDDELWLGSPPRDDEGEGEGEGGVFCSEGLDWKIVPCQTEEHNADNSLTGGRITTMENSSSPLIGSSQNKSSTFSPDSVLLRKSLSKEYTRYVLDDTTDSYPVRTRKISDLLDLNSDPKPSYDQETQVVVLKKCVHCGSSTTPQWRDGPEGPKTLCNACGIKYKKSLISEVYTPLRIIKSENEELKKCVHCESVNTPQWRDGPEGPKTLCNACGIQFKKGRPLRSPGFESRPYTEKVKEPTLTNNSENDHDHNHDHARKRKTALNRSWALSDLFGSDSDSDFEEKKCRTFKKIRSPSLRNKLPKAVDKKSTHFKTIQTSTPRNKLPKGVGKKCAHCETTSTPQWREGPMGRKTLCNACGVQYRHGRLFPEYRPLSSPTYDPSLHSHLPKKVEKMRWMKLSEERTTSDISKINPES